MCRTTLRDEDFFLANALRLSGFLQYSLATSLMDIILNLGLYRKCFRGTGRCVSSMTMTCEPRTFCIHSASSRIFGTVADRHMKRMALGARMMLSSHTVPRSGSSR